MENGEAIRNGAVVEHVVKRGIAKGNEDATGRYLRGAVERVRDRRSFEAG